MPHTPAADVLSDVKVLDLTRVRAGPTCVRQLADWGADVVKIETPPQVSAAADMGGPRHGSDFQNLHRNKRSMTLNLKEDEGRAIFLRMVESADVVVENYRPDVKDRLGIGYEALKAVNPRIILASISGFGQQGPYAKRPGFDQIAQGMGGLMSITGLPGQGPVRAGIPVADLTAGLFAAQGILLALYERMRSGQGQWLHTSLLEAMIFMLDFQSARWLMDGKVPQQAGNNHPTSIPTGVFRTSDGYMNIGASGQEIWRRFCVALGHAEWADNPDYATEGARSENRDALNAEIEAVTLTDTTAVWIARLNEAGVPCGPIYGIDEVFADEQVMALGMARPLASQSVGTHPFVRQPITMERTPETFVSAAPECGAHTDTILSGLGYDAAAIADLRARDIV